MKKNLGYLVVTFIIIAGSIGYGVYWRLSQDDEKSKEQGKKIEKKSVAYEKVETITASKKDLVMHINTTGTAKAIRELTISPEISGEIDKINIHENSFVNKNDVLFTIENEEYELNLQSAENKLTDAKISYGLRLRHQNDDAKTPDNSKELAELKKKFDALKAQFKSGKISKEEFEMAKVDLDVKELFLDGNKDKILKSNTGLTESFITYKKAKLDYENTIVKAPFSGYIAELDLTKKQYVSNAHKALRLVDMSTIKMEIPVLETEINEITEGRNVSVEFNSLKGRKFYGAVKYISPVVNEETKTCKVIVHIDNKDLSIKPGMNGNVTIEGKIYEDRLLVPKEAIIVRDQRKLLFVEEKGLAKWLYVKTGLENFDYVEVTSELKEGMNVIVSNNYTLAHNAKVKVISRDKKKLEARK